VREYKAYICPNDGIYSDNTPDIVISYLQHRDNRLKKMCFWLWI